MHTFYTIVPNSSHSWKHSLFLRSFVTLDHKTNLKGQFFLIEMYTSSESWINTLLIDVWFVRIGQYLEIHLYYLKMWYIYGMKLTKYLHETCCLLNILMIFGVKYYIFFLTLTMYCRLLLQIYPRDLRPFFWSHLFKDATWFALSLCLDIFMYWQIALKIPEVTVILCFLF